MDGWCVPAAQDEAEADPGALRKFKRPLGDLPGVSTDEGGSGGGGGALPTTPAEIAAAKEARRCV